MAFVCLLTTLLTSTGANPLPSKKVAAIPGVCDHTAGTKNGDPSGGNGSRVTPEIVRFVVLTEQIKI